MYLLPDDEICVGDSHAIVLFKYAFQFVRALTMQTLSWSLKSFITSNNVDLKSK